MGEDNNNKEIEWLRRDPQRLLSHYQYIIEIVAAKFVSRGFFSVEEKKDVVQQINLRLLEKNLDKIKEHYNGSVYLRTYFSKVVYNMSLEMARSGKNAPTMVTEAVLLQQEDTTTNPIEKMAIRDELLRLEAALKGLDVNPVKSQLCLKLFVRIILNQLDIQFYDAPKTREEIEKVHRHFFSNYESMTDKKVFAIIVQLFNRVEEKNTDGDSLRRWVHQLVDRLITLLNGEPPMSNHTRDSMKVLMRMYWEDKGR